MERESGWTFQQGKPLSAIAAVVHEFGREQLQPIREVLLRLGLIQVP